MSAAAPTPDRSEIARTLQVLHPEGVVELRALFHRGRKRTAAGYFDGAHRQDLVEQAAKLNEQGAAVYITMNALDAQLLGRYANRIEDYAQATATDTNVVRRHWLLIDIDPQRPKDTSATQEQLEAAMDRARKVYRSLTERGWPKPLVGESGNGAHLLYRIDLENNDAGRDLVKACLEALAVKFDDETVRIDKSVFNAARIVKLHGTVANKGDSTPATPWRLSRLRNVPERLETVSRDLLQALAAEAAPAPRLNGHDRPHAGDLRAWTETDVSEFLRRGGLEVLGEPAPHDGSIRWRLRRCPFNQDHGPTEAAVFLKSDGRLGFHCQHNSCADRHWSDLRELVDGPRESRHRVHQSGRNGVDSQHPQPAREKPEDRRVWPERLPDAAYQGLIGDIVRAVEPETESDPVAILMQVIVAFGALVGRGPHVRVEGDEHHLNLFALIAGDTSKARKGTSWSRVREIFSGIKPADAFGRTGWPRVVNGLSSGEGLKYNVRDERMELKHDKKTGATEEVLADAGVQDKRLLVVESEFAQVLRQGARAGNTLSATIRAAWDTGDLMTLTKNDPVTATGAHISIIGHITIDELRAELTATDSANGFANRFLLMCVRRSKLLPFGGAPLSDDTLRELVGRIRAAAEHARTLRGIAMTNAACQVWERVYPRLSDGYGGLLGAVTARAEAQCIRLALAYALADQPEAIDVPHLLAAIAVWERSFESATYVFGAALGDRVADEILRALRNAASKGMSRTDINYLFKGHESTERIGRALELLRERHLAGSHQQPGAGRPTEIWRAAGCEKSGLSEIRGRP